MMCFHDMNYVINALKTGSSDIEHPLLTLKAPFLVVKTQIGRLRRYIFFFREKEDLRAANFRILQRGKTNSFYTHIHPRIRS